MEAEEQLSEESRPKNRAVWDLQGLDEEVVHKFRLDRLPLERPNRSTVELMRLDGKVAIVTGGGGNGLGNAICHRLAEAGASIAVLDVDAGAAKSASDELADVWGAESLPVVANVADWDEAHEAVRSVIERFGTVDILVNNAGGFGAIGLDGKKLQSGPRFIASSKASIQTVVDVNFIGVMYMTRAVLDVAMLTNHSGRIINISSDGGKIGHPGSVAYNSSKSAVIGFTRNMAHEIGPEGISIVCVCPGIMMSKWLSKLLTPTLGRDNPLGDSFERATIGRVSIPDEVASVVSFLASDAGAYVHGTAVSVSGGVSD